MEVAGTLLLGLGLFFNGLTLLQSRLKEFSSSRFRSLVGRFVAPEWKAMIFGFVSGAVMQSSSASVAILASLSVTGMLSVRQTFPIIAGFNVGNCLLVFLATIDINIAVLFLAGLSGIGMHFATRDQVRKVFAMLFGLGLIFFSIALMKRGVTPLAHERWFIDAMTLSHESPLLSIGVGIGLGFIAQSSSVVAMVAISLVTANLLTVPQALTITYGAALGSNLFKVILGSSFTGSSRQLIRFQNLFNFLGATAMIALHYTELHLQIPLVIALLNQLSASPSTQVAYAFLLFNLVAAMLVTIGRSPIHRWLERLFPAGLEEELSRPQFLLQVQPEDADTAMELLWREQHRELTQIGNYFRTLGENYEGPSLSARSEAIHQLGRHVATAARDIMSLDMMPHSARRLGYLQTRQTILGELSDSTQEAVETIRIARTRPMIASLASQTHESLEGLMILMEGSLTAKDQDARSLVLRFCSDRGLALGNLGDTYLTIDASISANDREIVLNLATVVEKTVWLLRRLLRMGVSVDEPRIAG